MHPTLEVDATSRSSGKDESADKFGQGIANLCSFRLNADFGTDCTRTRSGLVTDYYPTTLGTVHAVFPTRAEHGLVGDSHPGH